MILMDDDIATITAAIEEGKVRAFVSLTSRQLLCLVNMPGSFRALLKTFLSLSTPSADGGGSLFHPYGTPRFRLKVCHPTPWAAVVRGVETKTPLRRMLHTCAGFHSAFLCGAFRWFERHLQPGCDCLCSIYRGASGTRPRGMFCEPLSCHRIVYFCSPRCCCWL